VIGVTCWTIGRGAVWELCRLIEKTVPGVFLVLGGHHASLFPEHVLMKTRASAVVVGEGETAFRGLLDSLERGTDPAAVPGLVLRGIDGSMRHTGPGVLIEDISTIPWPHYKGFKDFSLTRYSGLPPLPRPTAPIISSRGCVYDCTYCGSVKFWGHRWRYRSSEDILEEMEWLVQGLGARSIHFFDDNFLVNRRRVSAVCEGIIARGLKVPWMCCSHVRMVDAETLGLMRRSGCESIDFGVESGSDLILANINKKQTRSDIEKAFRLCNEAGIKARAYLMVGNKGESEKTIDETIDLIARIRPRSSIGATMLWLLPGTAVYREAVDKGFITDDFWLESDDVPINLQEHSLPELKLLRRRLMAGIAQTKGGLAPRISFWLKEFYYRFPQLAFFRSFVPGKFR